MITVRIAQGGLEAVKRVDRTVADAMRDRLGWLGARRLRGLIEALELAREL
ncbi:MAG: hypothetical protein ABSD56_15945 [Bryobacteraceae bacterium]